MKTQITRQIKNRFQGRRIKVDENLDFCDAMHILEALDGNILANYRYSTPFECSKEEISLHGATRLVYENFRTLMNDHTQVRHQVYAGAENERHYLNFAMGEVKSISEEGQVKTRHPFKTASIDFVVEKDKGQGDK